MISRDDRREAEDVIAPPIYDYCTRLDAADFEGMASLFQNGTRHIDPETVCHGTDEVRAWLEDNLIVHGDKLGTRHIISNLVTDVADDGRQLLIRTRNASHRGLPAPADLPGPLSRHLRQDRRRMALRRPKGAQ